MSDQMIIPLTGGGHVHLILKDIDDLLGYEVVAPGVNCLGG